MSKQLSLHQCLLIALILLFAASLVHADTVKVDANKIKPAQIKASAGEMDFLASLDTKDKKEVVEPEPPIYMVAISFVLKLAFVLGLAYITILCLKKFNGMKTGVQSPQQRIHIIENVALAANRSLHLVDVCGKRFLVSSTPGQISLVADLGEADIQEPESAVPVFGFKEQLAAMLAPKTNTHQAARSVAEMLRESSTYVQDKVREVGSLRGDIRGGGHE